MDRRTTDAVMIEQRAWAMTRRSIKTDAKQTALRLAVAMIDLTTLEGKDSPQKVRSLCRKAVQPYDGPLDLDIRPIDDPIAVDHFAGRVGIRSKERLDRSHGVSHDTISLREQVLSKLCMLARKLFHCFVSQSTSSNRAKYSRLVASTYH